MARPNHVTCSALRVRAARQAAAEWVLNDTYRNPGPIQFSGPTADDRTITLQVGAPARVDCPFCVAA